MTDWTPDIIKQKLSNTIEGVYQIARAPLTASERISSWFGEEYGKAFPQQMTEEERKARLSAGPPTMGQAVGKLSELGTDVASMVPGTAQEVALSKSIPLVAGITAPQWRRALSGTLRKWTQRYAKKPTAANRQALQDVMMSLEEMGKLPSHLTEHITAVDIEGSTIPGGYAGLFSPRITGPGGKLAWRGAKTSPQTPAHELGHYLQNLLREHVSDKLLSQKSMSEASEGTRKLYDFFTHTENLTRLNRQRVFQFHERVKDAYSAGLINREQLSTLSEKYIDLYHKIPTDEMVVENFGKLLQQGVPLKEAFKESNKLAIRTREAQRKYGELLAEHNKLWAKTTTDRRTLNKKIRAIKEEVLEFEQSLAEAIKDTPLHAERSRQTMIDDLTKFIAAETGNTKEALELGSLYETLPRDAVKRIWEGRGGMKMVERIAGKESVGAAPTGKWIRGASGRPTWQEAPGSLPDVIRHGTTGAPSVLPQTKGAIARGTTHQRLINDLKKRGMSDEAIGRLESYMQYMKPEEIQKLLKSGG